jgi:hypothetical protein
MPFWEYVLNNKHAWLAHWPLNLIRVRSSYSRVAHSRVLTCFVICIANKTHSSQCSYYIQCVSEIQSEPWKNNNMMFDSSPKMLVPSKDEPKVTLFNFIRHHYFSVSQEVEKSELCWLFKISVRPYWMEVSAHSWHLYFLPHPSLTYSPHFSK